MKQSSPNQTTRITGEVRIVGAGLLGTSIGLGLTKKGVDVVLVDSSPANLALAIDYGAGRAAKPSDAPEFIIICVPPDVTANLIANEMAAHPSAIVTDVASVKSGILLELQKTGLDLSNYVGSHPMAGRERGGAISGRADLFVGRPWVVAAHPQSSSTAIQTVQDLALDLSAAPTSFNPLEHDRAVALVSHLPQLISSLLAARLNSAAGNDISLAGQGLRDTTRIASSDPKLWLQILRANSEPVAKLLRDFATDLNSVVDALENVSAAGSMAALSRILESGNRGVSRIPGKHGSNPTLYAQLVVMINDSPGELARLLTEVGEIGVNLEDLKLEHSPGALIGLVELSVSPELEQKLTDALIERGWRLAG